MDGRVLVLGKITHLTRFAVEKPTHSSSYIQPQTTKVSCQLLRRLKANAHHPKSPGRLHVSLNVVDIYGFLRTRLAGFKRLFKDNRARFARSYHARVHSDRKVTEKVILRLHIGHMYWIGVGK